MTIKMSTNMDVRSAEYLIGEATKLGMVAANGGEEMGVKEIFKAKGIMVIPEEIWRADLWMNATARLFKYTLDEKLRFCAEVWVPYGGDGLYTHTYVFNREPTKEDVVQAHLIQTIDTEMSIRRARPEFTCKECSHATHWVDITAETLEAKWNRLLDEYCGC